jgi:hypothetical protein
MTHAGDAHAMTERAPEPADVVVIVPVIPAAQATTCPRCGAPRECCKASAAPGDPADHQGAEV